MENGTSNELRLEVEGLVCAGCAQDVEKILKNTDGIVDASVNYSTESIEVLFNPEKITKNEIYQTIRRLGLKFQS